MLETLEMNPDLEQDWDFTKAAVRIKLQQEIVAEMLPGEHEEHLRWTIEKGSGVFDEMRKIINEDPEFKRCVAEHNWQAAKQVVISRLGQEVWEIPEKKEEETGIAA